MKRQAFKDWTDSHAGLDLTSCRGLGRFQPFKWPKATFYLCFTNYFVGKRSDIYRYFFFDTFTTQKVEIYFFILGVYEQISS